jgi:hypothetical protein
VTGTHVVADVLKRAGTPLAPRDIAAIAAQGDKPMSYGVIYSALRKSPLFTKSGTKWWLKGAAIPESPDEAASSSVVPM